MAARPPAGWNRRTSVGAFEGAGGSEPCDRALPAGTGMPDEPKQSALVSGLRAKDSHRFGGVRMSPHPQWRGQRRIRVALEFSARGIRLAGMKPLGKGRPSNGRFWKEAISPRSRSVARRRSCIRSTIRDRFAAFPGRQQPGHSFTRPGTAVVYVDVPIAHEAPLGDISINVTDLSKLRQRPVDWPKSKPCSTVRPKESARQDALQVSSCGRIPIGGVGAPRYSVGATTWIL